MSSFACVNQFHPGLELNIVNRVFRFGVPGLRELYRGTAFRKGNRNLELTPATVHPGVFLYGKNADAGTSFFFFGPEGMVLREVLSFPIHPILIHTEQ